MTALWQNLPQFTLVAGLALVCYLFMRRAATRSAGRPGSNSGNEIGEPSRESTRDRALGDAPPEVVRWQVEMHETARDLKAELDSKMLALQSLIRLASEERMKLEAAIEAAERTGAASQPFPQPPADSP